MLRYHQRVLQRETRRRRGLNQPGRLPGMEAGFFFQARSAIYDFSGAARLFRLALKEGFKDSRRLQSKLEPALLYKYVDNEFARIACIRVDDMR